MTPDARVAFIRAVQERLAKALTPAMRRALELIYDALRDAVTTPYVLDLAATGRLDEAVDVVIGSARVGAARNAVRAELAAALAKAGAEWTALVVSPTIGLSLAYPVLNMSSMRALERLDLQFFPPIFEDTREAFTIGMRSALERGINPVDAARGLREFVGLTAYDAHIISTFELQLRGDPRRALARTLRDARFDATLQRAIRGAPLTEAQIIATRDAYIRRLTKWRAETWSRTAAINAVREANLAAWMNMAEALGIPLADVEKGWSTTLDGRERPAHHEADGTWVNIEEEYPVDGGVMTPGEGVWNCRCVMQFRLKAVSSRTPLAAA